MSGPGMDGKSRVYESRLSESHVNSVWSTLSLSCLISEYNVDRRGYF